MHSFLFHSHPSPSSINTSKSLWLPCSAIKFKIVHTQVSNLCILCSQLLYPHALPTCSCVNIYLVITFEFIVWFSALYKNSCHFEWIHIVFIKFTIIKVTVMMKDYLQYIVILKTKVVSNLSITYWFERRAQWIPTQVACKDCSHRIYVHGSAAFTLY